MRLIFNPRRWPRVAARLRADVLYQGREWQAETEDVGPKGCLLVSPHPLDPGAWVRLTLRSERLAEPLAVMGRVAWAAQMDVCRAGIAFAELQVEGNQDPFLWFERLVQATPGMVQLLRHVPDRLPVDAPLYLLPPPRFIVDFSPQELRAIAAIREGSTVEDVLRRTEREKRHEGRIVFALLARRVLTLSPQEACPPSAWRPLLDQAGVAPEPEPEDQEPEEVVRLEELPEAPEGSEPPLDLPQWLSPASPGWTEPAGAKGAVELAHGAGSERGLAPAPPAAARHAPAPTPAPAAKPAPAPTPAPAAAGPAPGAPGRGAGSGAAGARSPAAAPVLKRSAPGGRGPSGRSPQAQQFLDQALATAERGDVHEAIKLLRQALALAPRDPEIAAAIGRLAFKDRRVPET